MSSIIPIVLSNSVQKTYSSDASIKIDLIDLFYLDSKFETISFIPLNEKQIPEKLDNVQLISFSSSFYFKIPSSSKYARIIFSLDNTKSNNSAFLESLLKKSKPIMSLNQQKFSDCSDYKYGSAGNNKYYIQFSLPLSINSGIFCISLLDLYEIKLGIEARGNEQSTTTTTSSSSQLMKFPDTENVKSTKTDPSQSSVLEQLSISFEDGPQFRNLLLDFENKITKLKTLLKSTYENSVQFENLLDQMQSVNKNLGSNFTDLDKYLPSSTLNFYRNYQNDTEFDSQDNTNILNIISNSTGNNKLKNNSVHIKSMITKKSSLPSTISNNDISISNYKRIFEEESKKYYDWISKLLSSGKEKDEKLLSKRKDFELAKLSYFNVLFDQLITISFELILLNFNPDSKDLLSRNFNDYRKKFLSGRAQLISQLKSATSINDINKLLNVSSSNIDKSGILFTQGGQGKLGWHKQWVVLKNGKLYEFMDWRSGKSQRFSDPIDISLSNIKKLDSSNSNISKRKNCFRIITSKGDEHFYQAIDETDRDNWIDSLFLAGQQINFNKSNTANSSSFDLTQRTPNNNTGHSTKNSGNDVQMIPAPKSSELSKSLKTNNNNALNGSYPTSSPNGQQLNSDNTRARRVSSVSLNAVIMVQNVHPSNLRCCDCNGDKDVEWISINLLIVFCINCSGIHRNLGTSISKVRSLKLDSFQNNKELLFLLSEINNQRSNQVYEELLNSKEKSKLINADSKPEERMQFIKDKYQSKKYVNFNNSSINKNSLLIHGVKCHKVHEILQAFAMNVDPNLRVVKQIQTKNSNGETVTEDFEFSIFEYSLLNPTITQFKSPLKSPTESSQISDNSSVSLSSSTSGPESSLITNYIYETTELLVLNSCTIETKINTNLKLSKSALAYWQNKIDKLHGTQPSNQPTIKSMPYATPQKIPSSSTNTPSGSPSKLKNSNSSPSISSPSNTSKKFNLLKRRPKLI